MGIKDLPKNERPREKAVRYGLESLGNHELIALIIGSGTKGNSALDIAYELLESNNGLNNMSKKPYREFLRIKGLSDVSALKLGATFELFKRLDNFSAEEGAIITSEKIYQKYRIKLMSYDQEVLGIIILNRKRKILSEKIIYIGTKFGINTSIRDIFKELLMVGGHYFYLFHNHPSEDVKPSNQDIIFTRQVIMECSKLGFTMLDHVIISYNEYYSFKELSLKTGQKE